MRSFHVHVNKYFYLEVTRDSWSILFCMINFWLFHHGFENVLPALEWLWLGNDKTWTS